LDKARQQLSSILDNFYNQLPARASVLVLEPSCLSVFKDELHKLFPEDTRATDLDARTMTVAEFLTSQNIQPDKKLPHGIMHLHCHGKTTQQSERDWMRNCFDELEEPESGCCGMAGVFGIRAKTSAIGDKLYARSLQSAVVNSSSDRQTTIVSNGYSCRKQIEDNENIEVRHPVEIMDACIETSV